VPAAPAGGVPGRVSPLLAHLIVPRPDPDEDDEVIYVSMHHETRNSWDTSPSAAMTVTSYRGKPTRQTDLGELDPRDHDGCARILGQ
jgi:hypothetical protein